MDKSQECEINAINEKVAFIKINRLYPECVSEGGIVDYNKLKDCVRGNWIIRENRREKIEYIFALYQRQVVGIFHVCSVSKNFGDADLSDYPNFPPEVRKFDRWVHKFSTIEEAQSKLSAEECKIFMNSFQKDEDKNQKLQRLRQRVFFNVDDEIPSKLKEYMGCMLIRDGSAAFFRAQTSVTYNFES